MYVSNQLVRAQHDEWLRYAENRRLIKQALNASRESAPPRRRRRIARSALRLSHPINQG